MLPQFQLQSFEDLILLLPCLLVLCLLDRWLALKKRTNSLLMRGIWTSFGAASHFAIMLVVMSFNVWVFILTVVSKSCDYNSLFPISKFVVAMADLCRIGRDVSAFVSS